MYNNESYRIEKTGDSLAAIAREAGYTLDQIKSLNPDLADKAHRGGHMIKPGEMVCLDTYCQASKPHLREAPKEQGVSALWRVSSKMELDTGYKIGDQVVVNYVDLRKWDLGFVYKNVEATIMGFDESSGLIDVFVNTDQRYVSEYFSEDAEGPYSEATDPTSYPKDKVVLSVAMDRLRKTGFKDPGTIECSEPAEDVLAYNR